MLNCVVCVCSAADLEVWSVAAPRIVQNIASERYELIVPDNEVGVFKQNSPKDFEIIPESTLISDLGHHILQRLPPHLKSRCGWYLQQFIKLKAAERLSCEEEGLIWDADTVPLRSLNFFEPSEDGTQTVARFYTNRKVYPPYFKLVDRLIGINFEPNLSYIGQCIPLKGSWVKAFFALVEKRHQRKWEEVLIDLIDFCEPSGFSEYETLGSFFAANYPEQFKPTYRKWHRFGNRMLGHVGNLSDPRSAFLLRKYDFVSFERWDRRWALNYRLFWKLMQPFRSRRQA